MNDNENKILEFEKYSISDNNNNPIINNLKIQKNNLKKIIFSENSSPGEIAFKFCKENNLDYNTLNKIKNDLTNLKLKMTKSNLLYNSNFSKMKTEESSIKKTINSTNKNSHKLFFKFYQEEIRNYLYTSNLKRYKSTSKLNKKNISTKNENISLKKAKTNNYNNFNKNKVITRSSSNNIFDRLYNDAKIKQITYKRLCLLSNEDKKQIKNENNYDKKNNTCFSFNKTDKKSNEIQIIKEIEINKNCIHRNKVKPDIKIYHEFTFQPNKKYINLNNHQSKTCNNKLEKKISKNCKYNNDNKILENYFKKLFFELSTDKKNNILNNKNLYLKRINGDVLIIISDIINEIRKGEKEYKLEDFITLLKNKYLNEFSVEDKKIITNEEYRIPLYSDRNRKYANNKFLQFNK